MHKLELDSKTKQILKTFSIFYGLIVGMLILLVVFTFLSRNSWKNSLAHDIQNVLDTYHESQYTVGNNLRLDSAFSTSAAVYSLYKKDERKKEKYYGVIVRMPSILGPVPAVFIYNETYGVSFVGYAIDNGKASEILNKKNSNNVMNYWEKNIPEIISKVQER